MPHPPRPPQSGRTTCVFPPLPCESRAAKWGARGLGGLWLGAPVTQAVWKLAPDLGLQKRPVNI